MTFVPLGDGNGLVDLHHLSLPEVIATAVIELDDGLAIVDPGPTSTLDALERGLEAGGYSLGAVTHVLLTHIHLDHAGATGSILQRDPTKRVIVHERGARHMIDPSRLMASATRLYGDEMDTLWGEMVPVDAGSVDQIGSEDVDTILNGRFEVRYTPGHASHHISFFDTRTDIAYVGDTVGARSARVDVILPTTPPPDIDLKLLSESVDHILAWQPTQLFITHFGRIGDPARHVQEFRKRMVTWSDHVRASLDQPGDDAGRAADFAALLRKDIEQFLGPDGVASFEAGAPPDMSWYGLARYWRKKLEAES